MLIMMRKKSKSLVKKIRLTMCIPDICPCSDSIDICLCCLPLNLLCCCLPCCQPSRERVVYVPVAQPAYDHAYIIREPLARY